MAVYMLQLSRTEMLSTVLCSKFRGASFTFFQFLHSKMQKSMGFCRRRQNGLKELHYALKNAKIHGILPPEATWVEGITLIFMQKCKKYIFALKNAKFKNFLKLVGLKELHKF